MASRAVLRSVALLLGFWALALVVALNDIDFFSMSDLLDLHEPHHEHIVVALILCGLIAAGISLLWGAPRRTTE